MRLPTEGFMEYIKGFELYFKDSILLPRSTDLAQNIRYVMLTDSKPSEAGDHFYLTACLLENHKIHT